MIEHNQDMLKWNCIAKDSLRYASMNHWIAKDSLRYASMNHWIAKDLIKIIINKIIIKLLIEINKTGEKKCLYQEWI